MRRLAKRNFGGVVPGPGERFAALLHVGGGARGLGIRYALIRHQ